MNDPLVKKSFLRKAAPQAVFCLIYFGLLAPAQHYAPHTFGTRIDWRVTGPFLIVQVTIMTWAARRREQRLYAAAQAATRKIL